MSGHIQVKTKLFESVGGQKLHGAKIILYTVLLFHRNCFVFKFDFFSLSSFMNQEKFFLISYAQFCFIFLQGVIEADCVSVWWGGGHVVSEPHSLISDFYHCHIELSLPLSKSSGKKGPVCILKHSCITCNLSRKISYQGFSVFEFAFQGMYVYMFIRI